MKDFAESLRDGFTHITHLTDPVQITLLREEGILVDSEGYFSFSFGEHKEFELCFEPVGDEGEYLVALYKNRILLTQKVPVCQKPNNQQ